MSSSTEVSILDTSLKTKVIRFDGFMLICKPGCLLISMEEVERPSPFIFLDSLFWFNWHLNTISESMWSPYLLSWNWFPSPVANVFSSSASIWTLLKNKIWIRVILQALWIGHCIRVTFLMRTKWMWKSYPLAAET